MRAKLTHYIYVLLVMILSFIVLSNTAYALWSETLNVNMRMSMGEFDTRICYYKVLTCCHHCNVTAQLSEDGNALSISLENLHPGWVGWVGIVVCNRGTLPARILRTNVIITEGSSEIREHFHYKLFYYGIHGRHNLQNMVCCGSLPLPHNSSLPVSFSPGEKVLILTRLMINRGYHGTGELNVVFSIKTSL